MFGDPLQVTAMWKMGPKKLCKEHACLVLTSEMVRLVLLRTPNWPCALVCFFLQPLSFGP